MAAARSRIIRVAARAFVAPGEPGGGSLNPYPSPGGGGGGGGGNPVTVFLSHLDLPSGVRSDLARRCDWESVFVSGLPSTRTGISGSAAGTGAPGSRLSGPEGQNPVLNFYMPSGEEVAFCAHAALGAAAAAIHAVDASDAEDQAITFISAMDGLTHPVTVRTDGLAELTLSVPRHEETLIDDFMSLSQLRDALGLRMEDVSLGGSGGDENGAAGLPSYVNSSVSRPKTLLPIADLETLHRRPVNPRDPERFRNLCDRIGSTGIYLYCPLGATNSNGIDSGLDGRQAAEGDDERGKGSEEGGETVARYECRQFPRSSGYPEDPATGIAAAALAASLRRRRRAGGGAGVDGGSVPQYGGGGINGGGPSSPEDAAAPVADRYEFYQGTAMGRRSMIGVRFDADADSNGDDGPLSIKISGLVEITARDEVDVPPLS